MPRAPPGLGKAGKTTNFRPIDRRSLAPAHSSSSRTSDPTSGHPITGLMECCCAPGPLTFPDGVYRHCVMILTDAATWAVSCIWPSHGMMMRPFRGGTVEGSKPGQLCGCIDAQMQHGASTLSPLGSAHLPSSEGAVWVHAPELATLNGDSVEYLHD
ncbi:uncharacterized protein M421DRAFT_421624 [Didymella exigua CBS 183.55]|uniref:Uncharacterized protein n=1 Tax=Didymella exigua CBS 183.55 TaxID=1150837 RepID=A0A6A5RJZ3_9PLEO|nr:uncharacterized protein M421DRAFT_421624 [Didymella exigua CBS 183.55]KAF1927783.1 hypothetical protein M421DRAFT_421624 [Didymella exigua CBS 183.55]